MPVKTPHRRSHHTAHKKEKRTKHFLKVYAPYIPLLIIVGCGLVLSMQNDIRPIGGEVKSYATNTSDDGLLEETNKRRATEHLQPLKYNATLDQAAQNKAVDMKTKNYWAHNTPEGQEPWVFIEQANYHYRKAAENLAFGFDNSNSTLNGWMNSPGHRANIMDPDLTEVGFGIINIPDYQGHGPETLVVAMYGQPSVAGDQTAPAPTPTPQTTIGSSQPTSVSAVQSLTGGKAPWSTFVVGLIIGGGSMYLVVKHARRLRKTIRRGERFVVHHPLFDITLVALIALAALLSQNIGSIY